MIAPKKSLGQHFLTNPKIVEKIVAAGDVTSSDIILEIGPGTGVLTEKLLETGAKVIAVEADARAVDVLQETFKEEIAEGRFTLHHADIRTITIESLDLTDRGYKVIANIPYYISGMLFEKMLTSGAQPSTLVFLVQKEVAERVARSEKESLLSLSVKAYGEPRYISTVAKGNFAPPPKVDSAILAVSNISRGHFEHIDEAFFFTVLHAGFKARRKQLLGNLTELAPRETLTNIFSTLDIPLDIRGEDIALTSWLSLTSALETHTKSST